MQLRSRHRSAPLTQRRRSRDRGQSLSEFALIIPVFLLVMSGIFDFGYMLYSRLTIINATREATRAATIVPGYDTIDAIVDARVKSDAFAVDTSAATMSISAICIPIKSTPTCDFSSGTSAKPGDAVKVTVTYDYHLFFPLLFGNIVTFSSTAQMVLE